MKLSKKIIIIAIILAFVTTFGIYSYIRTKVNQINYVEVWVAKTNIPARSKIDDNMIKTEKIAEEYALKNSIRDKKHIIGKHTIERIIEGEQILYDRMVELNKTFFSYHIPKGQRAVTINVDEVTGVAHLIRPGDYVDVLVFISQREIDDKLTRTVYPDVTKLILQNMLVLAIDQEQEYEEKKEIQPDEQITERKITLSTSPIDAEKLIMGDEIGKIHLALRHPEDNKKHNTTGTITSDIIPEKGRMILQK